MESDSVDSLSDEPEVLCRWSARKLRPIVLLWVALVSLAFIALGYFVFHSMTAVKTLAMTAVASLVPLVPAVLSRVEYRITGRKLERRPVNKEKPREFEAVFETDQLSHIVPMRHGFKFYRPLNESNPLLRFWKAHVSDAYSGEVHVEEADRESVMEILDRYGIPSRLESEGTRRL